MTAAVALLFAAVFLALAAIAGLIALLLRQEGAPGGSRRAVTAVALAFLVFAGMAGWQAARAHSSYEHWTAPDNPALSCCHGEDCRPTRACLADDGLWRAWDGKRWLLIPPGRVLPMDYAGDGRSHLCARGGRTV